jgi:hypothetical protein
MFRTRWMTTTLRLRLLSHCFTPDMASTIRRTRKPRRRWWRCGGVARLLGRHAPGWAPNQSPGHASPPRRPLLPTAAERFNTWPSVAARPPRPGIRAVMRDSAGNDSAGRQRRCELGSACENSPDQPECVPPAAPAPSGSADEHDARSTPPGPVGAQPGHPQQEGSRAVGFQPVVSGASHDSSLVAGRPGPAA